MNKFALAAFVGTFCLAGGKVAWAADDILAMSICKSGSGANAYAHDTGFVADSASGTTEILCPIKKFNCTTAPCTYSADAIVLDGNSVNAADSNVTCGLRLTYTNSAGSNVHGTTQTASGGTYATLSMTVTEPNGLAGWMFLRCVMGKNDVGTGQRSFLTWITLP